MTKSEFLERLRSALGNDLSGAIIQENVTYYDSYISEEVRKGRSEREVIEELGDPWALAQTIISSAEGQNTVDSGYDRSYGYEGYSGQDSHGDHDRRTGDSHVFSFGFDTWWKKLLLVLVLLGVVIVAGAIISGVITLLAPLIIPVIIIMIVVRIFNRR